VTKKAGATPAFFGCAILGHIMQPTTDDLLSFAKGVAHEAGGLILQYFDSSEKDVQIKADESPVTIADKLINQLVIDRVATSFPEHGVLAEEGSQNQDRKQLWVCDPIDGTKGFIQRIPTSLFSLAYVVDGRPEVAVVADPFQNKIFSAVRGKGAWVNDQPIKVTTYSELKGATVAIGVSYHELKIRMAFFDKLLDRGVNQLMVPGNVFRSSLVATGNIEAHIFPGKSAHDVAAAKLIIEEAGGKVTDLYGKEQRYDGRIYGAIITNGSQLHNQLVELIGAFGPENYVGY
jgi:fructose-1,6-bisphosphatase/inositol monophosphatase family enzyme